MFKRFWWMFLVMLPIGAVAGLLVTAVITYVMPKKYESDVTIEVRPPAVGLGPLDAKGPAETEVREVTPRFFGTEFEVIKSRKSLGQVADALELVNRWNVDKETAISILKNIVTTQNIRGTDLISIRVRHTNKTDARDVAEEVARTYKNFRQEMTSRDQDRALRELTKLVREQEDKVEERRKILATIVRMKGIPDKGAEAGGDSSAEKPEDAIKKMLDAQDYVDAKRDFETDSELLQTLKLKQVAETIRGKMANEGVAIHDEAVIAHSPVSPNVTLNLILGIAIGFLVSPLMTLPVIWILNRRMPLAGR
jgi:uncharacterized protein involved in exopolysaccharide biosynthesis